MILQALAVYYQRLVEEGNSDLAAEGLTRKPIPFVFVIDLKGKLLGIDDTRTGDGKKKQARYFMVPKVFEGSRTVNVEANLLWDKASYVLGVGPKTKPGRLAKQQKAFRRRIDEYFPELRLPDEAKAVVKFLENGIGDLQKHKEWQEISTVDPNIAFRLTGQERLVCSCPEILEAVVRKGNNPEDKQAQCLVTGESGPAARLENPIKGIWNSGVAESHWVAFNKPAYWSYAKVSGTNAPIGKNVSFAYSAALNRMLAWDSRQKIQVGDATTVFWAEKKSAMESDLATLIGVPAQGEPEQDYKKLLSLYRSPETGARVGEFDPNTKFYVLGLSPNAARIAVRFWYAGTVGDLADSIWQHFDDLEIVKGDKDWHDLRLQTLLRSTALPGKDKKDKNVLPNLAGDTMKAILTGQPYPRTLLSAVVTRIKAEQGTENVYGNVTYTRAALLKAILTRDARYYKRNEKEVGMSLDTSITNPGYLLGRLFAVLERAQEYASPGINATIRDRFYGAASSIPVTVFPHLMKLKNYHIAKIENKGQAVNLEKQIGEIVGKLDAADAFPSHLNLQEQGRFALGYYHQRQDFFTKKDNR